MTSTEASIAQGLLPFVGREKELESVLAFWRSIPEAQRLRVMLLTAEAGVGKSRLLEESLRTIGTERGAVVHVKLYPEAANSLAELISRSIWKSGPGRDILPERPGERLPDVVNALQRLSRLRPTLLVLEDIHLFPSESIPDLARLFDGLADETISVLCLSRPVSIPALGVLEPYLIESLTMSGLSRDAIARLWAELFSGKPPKTALDRLHSITRGNALAIRSGLRSAVSSGALMKSPGSGEWTLAVPVRTFESGLRRSVSLVAEGMVAHIGNDDRHTLELLATLGEVFARESAGYLLPDSKRSISNVMESGLVVETFHPVSPLSGRPLTEPGKGWRVEFPSSSFPLLAFTHSLLHAYLAERAETDVPGLLNLVADDGPIYSLLPLRLLEEADVPAETESETLILVIRRLSAIAVALDQTANWRDGADLLRPMYRLLELLESRPDVEPETKRLWRMNAQHISLSVLRREKGSPDWIAIHERQLEVTRAPETLLAAQYRLLAHTYVLDRIDLDKSYDEAMTIVPDFDELLESFPELRVDISYVYVLESLIQHAYTQGDEERMRDVQRRTQRLLADPELGELARREAIRRILPVLLRVYSTPEELREREESIDLIETIRDERDPYYGSAKIQFLAISGKFDEALDLADIVARNAFDRGLWSTVFITQSWRMVCETGVGGSFPPVVEDAIAFLSAIGDVPDKESYLDTLAGGIVLAGLLAGTLDEALRSLTRFELSTETISAQLAAIVALWHGDVERCLKLGQSDRAASTFIDSKVFPVWRRMYEAAGASGEGAFVPDSSDIDSLIERLTAPVVQIYDVLIPQSTVRFWAGLTDEPLPPRLLGALLDSTERSLLWLHERDIPAYLVPLSDLLGRYGSENEAETWRGKAVAGHRPARAPEESEPVSDRIRISMLGTIRVALPPDDYAPIRGIRIRTLLGLMVADKMIATPLSAEEFVRLAGSDESDPERARKKKNMAVVRLREILGHDAILTDGPTPQLNPDLVCVDLLELSSLIDRGLDEVRQDAFVRALPLIGEALDLHNGEVPFPTLYDDFFEAARQDLEYRLRRCVVEGGSVMLQMGDAAGAIPLLRKAFDALPGDEEIGDLLRRALEETGNRVESERVRMRAQTTG